MQNPGIPQRRELLITLAGKRELFLVRPHTVERLFCDLQYLPVSCCRHPSFDRLDIVPEWGELFSSIIGSYRNRLSLPPNQMTTTGRKPDAIA